MDELFSGFPEAALDFLEDLADDNSKAFWDAHRDVYAAAVRGPLEALLRELEPEFGPGTVFRPYRDLRFRKDRSRPYKEQAAAAVHGEGGTGLYVELSAAGLYTAGGLWRSGRDQVLRLREAVDDERRGGALQRLLARLERDGFAVDGQTLVRVPKPYAADHPRADLLRRTTLHAGRRVPPTEPALHTPGCRDLVVDTWRALGPLNAWLAEHVGASALPRRDRP